MEGALCASGKFVLRFVFVNRRRLYERVFHVLLNTGVEKIGFFRLLDYLRFFSCRPSARAAAICRNSIIYSFCIFHGGLNLICIFLSYFSLSDTFCHFSDFFTRCSGISTIHPTRTEQELPAPSDNSPPLRTIPPPPPPQTTLCQTIFPEFPTTNLSKPHCSRRRPPIIEPERPAPSRTIGTSGQRPRGHTDNAPEPSRTISTSGQRPRTVPYHKPPWSYGRRVCNFHPL